MWGPAHAEIALDSFKFQGSGVFHRDEEFWRSPAQFLLLMDHFSTSPMPNHYLCTVQQNPMVTYNYNQQQQKKIVMQALEVQFHQEQRIPGNSN